ncbi:MAG: DinB family protein [Candidatus Thorarchaeota archaeon]|jgi:uncharacterized damage-inducible protein DinB
MKDIIIETIREGLHGQFAHSNSLDILDRLTHEEARKQTIEDNYSSWEILFHIVFWQDRFLDMIRGEEIDFAKAVKEHWPTSEKEKKDEWRTLVERFKNGIAVATSLLTEVDLTSPVKSYRKAPTFKAFMSLAQHNSYHLGQIVINRRAQGSWSPKKS